MQNPLFTADGFYMTMRWIHYFAAIAWIGHLYYFNFVQGAFFAETDANTKSAAVRQLVPKALWWFRWGAAYTWISGMIMIWHRGHVATPAIYQTSWGVWILTGAALGTLMAANVWFVIWPAQKRVIANANAAVSGGQQDPTAAKKAAQASVASRTNVLFSIPLLFFMGAASHLPLNITASTSFLRLIIVLGVIIGALELNALFGKNGPMTTVKGVIHCGVALAAVLYVVICALA